MKTIKVIVGSTLFTLEGVAFPNNKIYVGVDKVLGFFGLSDEQTMARFLSEGSRYQVAYTETETGGRKKFLVPAEFFHKWLDGAEKYIFDENHKKIFSNFKSHAIVEVITQTSKPVTVADIWRLEGQIEKLAKQVDRIEDSI